MPGLSQRSAHAFGRGCVDRCELAGIDDGELVARSVLAGQRAEGSARLPGCVEGDSGRVRDMSYADVAHRSAARRSRRGCVRSPACHWWRRSSRSPRARRRRMLDVPPDNRSEPGHTSQLHGRLCRLICRSEDRVPGVRTLQNRARDDDHHAVGDRVPTDRGFTREAIRVLRDLPHAGDEGAWSQGRGRRRAARANALSGVEAQRLRRGTAQLPVVSHAGGGGGHTDCVRSRRAAQRPRAPYVRRRQCLHAADARPLSAPVGCGRHGGRDEHVDRRDCGDPSKIDRRVVNRARRTVGRTACRGYPCAKPHRSQAADRLSVSPHMAPRERPRSEWASRVRIRCHRAERRHCRQRQR